VLEFVENRQKGTDKKEPDAPPAGTEAGSSMTSWSLDELLNKSDDPEKVYLNAEKIGEGAAGEVFVATHVKSGNKVAIKKMDLNKDNTKLLITEIGIMKTSIHPNIVTYYDTCVSTLS